jgi:hypothetical protein
MRVRAGSAPERQPKTELPISFRGIERELDSNIQFNIFINLSRKSDNIESGLTAIRPELVIRDAKVQ